MADDGASTRGTSETPSDDVLAELLERLQEPSRMSEEEAPSDALRVRLGEMHAKQLLGRLADEELYPYLSCTFSKGALRQRMLVLAVRYSISGLPSWQIVWDKLGLAEMPTAADADTAREASTAAGM
eukprot:3664573-Prymnesium_polylepis.1